jgi:hypothetical protein
MALEKDERLGATLRTLTGSAGWPDFLERVTDGEIHQTIRRTRFHPTNIIDAAEARDDAARTTACANHCRDDRRAAALADLQVLSCACRRRS